MNMKAQKLVLASSSDMSYWGFFFKQTNAVHLSFLSPVSQLDFFFYANCKCTCTLILMICYIPPFYLLVLRGLNVSLKP